MNCKKCGHPIQTGDRFCSRCGTPVPQTDRDEPAGIEEEVVYNSPEHSDRETVSPAREQKFALMFEEQPEEETAAPSAAGSGVPEAKEEAVKADSVKADSAVAEEDSAETPIDFSEFSWNVQDFPKPKKVEDIEFRWHDPDQIDITLRNKQGEETEKPPASGSPEEQKGSVYGEEALLEYETDSADMAAGAGGQSGNAGYDVPSMLETESPAEKEARIRALEEEIFGEALSSIPQGASQTFAAVEQCVTPASQAAEPVAQDAIGDDDMERFFTFSKKNEEFQKLLDKEYERIQKRTPEEQEEGTPAVVSVIPAAPVASEVPVAPAAPVAPVVSAVPSEEKAEEVLTRDTKPVELRKFIESKPDTPPEEPAKSKPSAPAGGVGGGKSGRVVGYESPQIDEMEAAMASFFGSTAILDNEEIRERVERTAGEEAPKAPVSETREANLPSSEEQTDGVLTETPEVGLYQIRTDDSPLEGPRERGTGHLGIVGKVILTVVILILAGEAAMLGIKYFAPQSPAAVFIDKVQAGVIGIFRKDQGEEPPDGQTSSAPTATIEELIYQQRGNNYGEDGGNIREVKANPDLKFDPAIDYGVEDLNASTPIKDNYWLTDANGVIYNYDATAVGTVMAYDSMWTEYANTGDNAVFNLLKPGTGAYEKAMAFEGAGKMKEIFKLLEIGEIRQGSTGFYVWTHELISVTEDGTETPHEYYRIYYVEPDGNAFRLIDYYAYNQ